MIRVLSFLFFVFYLAISQASSIINLTINAKEKQFSVTLPANATTGYQWSLVSYDKKVFELIDQHYVAPNTKLIGAGGEMIFTFGLNPGQKYPQKTSMKFSYARPWEANSASVQVVDIVFN